MPHDRPEARLLVETAPRDGLWNMAFDEALLEAAVRRGQTALRVYRWSEPTVSLGYFQKSLPPDFPQSLARLPHVRRLSGGGAILHHHEWTYSCCVPRGHRFAGTPEILYGAVHTALITAFARCGVTAAMRGQAESLQDGAFLCFQRGDPRDVLVGGQKVVGSAQRRRRGAVLQHGSVLLKRSPYAPDIPGIIDLTPGGVRDEPNWAVDEFLSIFAAQLFTGPISREPAAEDEAAAERSG